MWSILRVFVLLFTLRNSHGGTEDQNYRLPDTIIPLSYELKITPNLKDEFDFSGEVTINVRTTANTKEVTLHCYNLNITAISISNETEKISHDGHEYDANRQLLKLKIRNELTKNSEYGIRALFRGLLTDQPYGFYKEQYKQGDEIKWVATTQLEPIYARTVFPCFDEPHFKTPFSIHIARSESQMSVANMPYIMSKGPEMKIQNRTWDMFESKLPISTYQVAFIVTEYSFQPEVENGLLFGTPNRNKKKIFEVLSKSKIIMNELESYTNKSFNKESMRMVSIYNFLVGAFENAGLSTIKDTMIVHTKRKTSKLSKEVSELAAQHEFAHQWFGDDITPVWWNYTWLKDSFATLLEYKILNKIEPKWKMEELFITDVIQQALSRDKHARAMISNVQTPSEIVNSYDFVLYQKGAAILKMLEFIITPSTFQKGVQRYLRNGSNKTTVTADDLWEAMDQEVLKNKIKLPKTVREIMKPWTEQSGYPLLTVTVYDTDVSIKQEPYNKHPESNETWIIPITYAIESNDIDVNSPMEWLHPYEQLVLDNAVEHGQWVIVNLAQTGYYRVNYDYNNWEALTKQLEKDHNAIPPLQRAKLIDDALNLAVDEKLNYNTALFLLNYFPQEEHYLPQISILYNLKNLYQKFEQTSVENELKQFMAELITKLYKSLGISNGYFDTYITYRIRKDVVYLACKVGIEKCQKSASSLFNKNYKSLDNIDENLKPAIFCTALEHLREDFVFNNLLKHYNKTNSILDREIIINSFACLKNDTIIKKILSNNVTVLRPRDLQKAKDVILQNGRNPKAVAEYIRSVLASINGNTIPENIESYLKFIIRNMKIVNTAQLSVIKNLLSEVKELERFHSVLSELVDRSQNATTYIRETERAARQVNETIYEYFTKKNDSKKLEFLFHPINYFKNKFKDSHKIQNGIAKMNNLRNQIFNKITNVSLHLAEILHLKKTIKEIQSTVVPVTFTAVSGDNHSTKPTPNKV